MSTSVSGLFETASGPTNGASVDLWLSSRFAGAPSFGSAPPAGGPDYGPVTTGTAFGAPGAWVITSVTDADYYARAVYASTNYWAGPFSATDNSDVVHVTGTETIGGAKTFSSLITGTAGLTISSGTSALQAVTGTTGAFTGAVTIGAGPLTVSTITGTTSLVSGTHYLVSSGTFTGTLPAPTNGAVVKVTNYGSGVVTVAQRSAEKIFGPTQIAAGVNSFTLGWVGASVTLESEGTSWYVTAGGGLGAAGLFYDNIMGSDSANWTVSNIPVGYESIVIDVYSRITGAVATGNVNFQLNGDTAGNYYGAYSLDFAAPTNYSGSTVGVAGIVNGASAQASFFGHSRITIANYTQTTNYHTVSATGGCWPATASGGHLTQCFATWGTLAAVNQVFIASSSNNFKAGSRLTIWLQ